MISVFDFDPKKELAKQTVGPHAKPANSAKNPQPFSNISNVSGWVGVILGEITIVYNLIKACYMVRQSYDYRHFPVAVLRGEEEALTRLKHRLRGIELILDTLFGRSVYQAFNKYETKPF